MLVLYGTLLNSILLQNMDDAPFFAYIRPICTILTYVYAAQ